MKIFLNIFILIFIFLSKSFCDEYIDGRIAIVSSFPQYESAFYKKQEQIIKRVSPKIIDKQGIPYNVINVIKEGPNNEIYYGTPVGLIKEKDGKFKYYAGKRWLLDDYVLDIAIDKDDTILVTTRNGISKIYSKNITLSEKAEYFLKRLRARHIKMGFVREMRTKDGFLGHSDNDGLWTSLYVAAESFRYAVTGDKSAQKNAKESFYTLEWLERITGISGFPARSIVEKGEPEREKYDGEWHLDRSKKWEWKGDTSADELAGHFFAYSIFYDLAADDEDKKRITELVRRIGNHLVDNNFYLVDIDGKPTTWGIYNSDDPRWWTLKGLNSLKILSHLSVCYHITGDKKFKDAYDYLVKRDYAKNTLKQKLTISINHSDDQLAFLAYYPLLKYEKDEKLLEIYKKSLRRTWNIERPERNPWWNFTYCAFTEGNCDIENSIRTLKEIPMDIRNWTMKNSHRLDVGVEKKLVGRFGELESTFVLPYDERCFFKWNGNPYRLDGCGDGTEEDDGTFFLLPYWMGRYHKFIIEKE